MGARFYKTNHAPVCVSVHADGTVILGRGITDEWLNSGKAIAWKNVRINNDKKIDFSIKKKGKDISIDIKGDTTQGPVLIDIPMCVNNIASVNSKTEK